MTDGPLTDTSTHLSIGEVLGLLQQNFPDVTISKIRFLESQGLIDPERTPSGYRKFYEPDIERLRWILHQQRENFLPLKVIKDRLENGGPLSDDALDPVTDDLADQAPESDVDDTADLPHPHDTEHDLGSGDVETIVDPSPVADEQVPAPIETAPAPEAAVVDPWHGDPTMEFDFASLTAGVESEPESATPAADESRVEVPESADIETAAPATAPIPDVVPIPEAAQASDDALAEVGPSADVVAPADEATPWGANDLDRALSGRPESHVVSDSSTLAETDSGDDGPGAAEPDAGVDVDLVELEEVEHERIDGADSEADEASSTVTDRLRSGELAHHEDVAEGSDAAEDERPADVGDGDVDAGEETIEESRGEAGMYQDDDGGRVPRRPAVERYFSSDYDEPLDPVALTVEELAGRSSLSVSQIRELEHFGIVAGESVGPDIIYNEESLAIAQAAQTFLARGVEPRHLRPFAMAADREVGLYEQLALPVIRKRDPGTQVEADKLLASLFESGGELRSLLVKRGIRNNFGR